MGLVGTGGRALGLKLAAKFRLQICPFASLSPTRPTCKMQVTLRSGLTAASTVGRPGHLFPGGSPMRPEGLLALPRMGKIDFKRRHTHSLQVGTLTGTATMGNSTELLQNIKNRVTI